MSAVPQIRPADALRRDAALERLLFDDLLDLLSEADEPDHHRWLLTVLDALLRIHHGDTEDYLAEVLDENPNWDRQVQALNIEHCDLWARLGELRQEAFQSHPRISHRCRLELSEWIEHMNDHNGRKTALLQTAINLEVGVGD